MATVSKNAQGRWIASYRGRQLAADYATWGEAARAAAAKWNLVVRVV